MSVLEEQLKKCKWLDYERSNKKKLKCGLGFLIISGLVIVIISFTPKFNINIIYKIFEHLSDLIWVCGWSGIGIGAGLINRRIKAEKEQERENQYSHYLIYYLFAFFVSSLAAFALGRHDGTLDISLSALIGLTLGFAADKFNELPNIS